MARFSWDAGKNEALKADRGISFEDVLRAIGGGRVLDVVDNPNQLKYPGQRLYVVEINGYAYYAPFSESAKGIEFKTVYASRKATKKYLKGATSHGQAGSD